MGQKEKVQQLTDELKELEQMYNDRMNTDSELQERSVG